ncbi:MAG: DUF928 domain-containing protein [bacterium]|nr:DUF928 domain-containing protein [bacterium]
MSESDARRLERLWRALEGSDLPSPDLVARYVDDPNGLSPEERDAIDRALAHSAAVIDEADTLRGFDFSALEADRRAAEVGAGRAGWALRWRPWAWAAAAAAVALFVSVALLDDVGETGPTAPPTPPTLADRGSAPAPSRPEASEEDESGTPPVPRLAEAVAPDLIEPEPDLAPVEPAVEAPEALALAPDPAPPAPTSVGPSPAPSAPPEEAPVRPAERPREMLLAMATPAYQPAFGLDVPGGPGWTLRSVSDEDLSIAVVSPDHVTRVSVERPVLHWAIDGLPADGGFYLSVLDGEGEPVIEDQHLPSPVAVGLQRTPLASLPLVDGRTLPEGETLRWSIEWREGLEAPTGAVDFGWLRLSPLELDAVAALASTADANRSAFFAGEGCFHESLEAALALRDAHPDAAFVDASIRTLLERTRDAARAVLAIERDPGR